MTMQYDNDPFYFVQNVAVQIAKTGVTPVHVVNTTSTAATIQSGKDVCYLQEYYCTGKTPEAVVGRLVITLLEGIDLFLGTHPSKNKSDVEVYLFHRAGMQEYAYNLHFMIIAFAVVLKSDQFKLYKPELVS